MKKVPKIGGDTPLHYAAQMGYVEVCELIIKNITMKNPPNSNSNVMIDNLSNSGSESESESEYNRSSDSDSESDFYVAPKRHKLSFDQERHQNPKERNPNPMNFEGDTPLHIAVQNGNFDLCKLILKYAYDVNPIGSNGLSILHTAAKNGHYETFQIFLKSFIVIWGNL